MPFPKVSVWMLAYNHAPFIRQAVESALMQETNFDFEIVIGEDCSTDGTREVLLELAASSPSKIRLLLAERNLGAKHNARRTFEACCGEYIALLEGDDYWTSPTKLQQQVDIMDQRPDVNVCIHDVEVIGSRRRGKHVKTPWPQESQTVGFEYFLKGGVGYTCSALLRHRAMPQWQELFESPGGSEYAYFILTTIGGFAVILPDKMAVYRLHEGGVSSSRTEQEQLIANHEMFLGLETHLPASAAKLAKEFRLKLLADIVDVSVREREKRQAAEAAFYNSQSYRLGSTLLWPLRVTVGLFRICFKMLLHQQ